MTEVSCSSPATGSNVPVTGGLGERTGIPRAVETIVSGSPSLYEPSSSVRMHAEVVADDPTEVPAVGVVDAGRVLEALDADVELVVDDGADIGLQVGLAVPGHGGCGESPTPQLPFPAQSFSY